MKQVNKRRSFLKQLTVGGLGAVVTPGSFIKENEEKPAQRKEVVQETSGEKRQFNAPYTGEFLSRVAFPIGGIGAGMFCLEGTGAISHMSVRHRPEIFHEPAIFAALSVKGLEHGAKVLEGPVPERKFFGQRGAGNGAAGTTFGLPRFTEARFETAFPYGKVQLKDKDIPFHVEIKGWSPFIPGDEDNSSLPVGALEYTFINKGTVAGDCIFSFNSKNFMVSDRGGVNSIEKTAHGFILSQQGTTENPERRGSFAVFTIDEKAVVDYCWFRGGWWDPITMAWNAVKEGRINQNEPVEKDAPGASLYIPFTLAPGARKTIRLMMAWWVPQSNLHIGEADLNEKKDCDAAAGCCSSAASLDPSLHTTASTTYRPWYSSRFAGMENVIEYWLQHYEELDRKSHLFQKVFYASTLPAEVMEAVAANLTILKSPTVLRQYDGRLWSWEGCGDDGGCCHGSCTHVWNYAQAMPHLFPALERSLRHTEFCENQSKAGHQGFRANMPISPIKHDFHAAADGQLGGIMKVHREWRTSGDHAWLANIYPMVKVSMDYCIQAWDPMGRGVVEEPHHNTYDIEFWGPDGMCTSFYLGALTAMVRMGSYLKKDVAAYEDLLAKGRQFMETRLFNGAYFIQDIEYRKLKAPDPATALSFGGNYSAEAKAILQKEGPKYQYGKGCLSDGVLGQWIGRMCGLDNFIDAAKVRSHLESVYKYNLKKDLSEHANPQRPAYALGHEGGLLLCTWPQGGKLSLPFVYSDEVWTGIEYQVASHLMLMGKVKEGLEIVRTCRQRYDGRIRNPFNEYECGHWYARAMSSYGLLEGLTGLRYDAVDQVLHVDSRVGDFTCFIATEKGFGNVSLKSGKLSIKVASGAIPVSQVSLGGRTVPYSFVS